MGSGSGPSAHARIFSIAAARGGDPPLGTRLANSSRVKIAHARRCACVVAAALLLGALGACAGHDPGGEGVEEGAALSQSVPIGSTLVATGNLNLRSGPSTSSSVLHVIPKG